MVIAVDAMGGDYAPEAVVEGAVRAHRQWGYELLLVGPTALVEPLLRRFGSGLSGIRCVEAPEVVGMDESPAQAVRRKKNASLVVCGELVRRGEAGAFVSAGNTGAGMAVALMKLGRIPGVDRPAIATPLPALHGRILLLDAGANVDCAPHNLLQFAILGSVYAREVFGVAAPRVGLLNIGEEATKGTQLCQEAYALLSQAPIRFVGNVEARDIFRDLVDIVVCDGFVGNVTLKMGEGVVDFLRTLIQAEIRSRPWLRVPAAMLMPALRRIQRQTDYREAGGAQLLGVEGVCIISHGRSDARAICNAIRTAGEEVQRGLVAKIRSEFAAAGQLVAPRA